MDPESRFEPAPASFAGRQATPAGAGKPRQSAAALGTASALAPYDRDPSHSVAHMAHRDLDAALQLLAERAQYITDASGAAIALRRGDHDMLCRASIGSSAPELGALLSMEFGLSGECVRTRQPLRCDDAERDLRVNHEVCRQLGIASVVLMPIVSDDHVLGVFELFSGRPRAFQPRDVSALQRLSAMVEVAVKHAAAAQEAPSLDPAVALQPATAEPAAVAPPAPRDVIATSPEPEVNPAPVMSPPQPASIQTHPLPDPIKEPAQPAKVDLPPRAPEVKTESLPATKLEPLPHEKISSPRQPLFWSSSAHAHGSATSAENAEDSVAVPPVLRDLRKCQACGFPISHGRTFCVECEEKQWRGQLPKPAAPKPAPQPPAAPETLSVAPAVNLPQAIAAAPAIATEPPAAPPEEIASTPPEETIAVSPEPTLFGAAAESESWLFANRFILGAVLLLAIVIAVIAFLR